jgi:hypothetical protein
MYTKGNGKNAKHEWTVGVESLGHPSYVYVRKYVPMGGNGYFSSLAQPGLSLPTFLQVPRTHLLFSLGSLSTSFTHQPPLLINGASFPALTLCPWSLAIFQQLSASVGDLYQCASDLKKRLSPKRKGNKGGEDEESGEEDEQ